MSLSPPGQLQELFLNACDQKGGARDPREGAGLTAEKGPEIPATACAYF